MEKIVKKDGYVYLVQDFDRKGFETYVNMGKDIDSPMWKEEVKEMSQEKPKKVKRKDKSED